MESTDTSTPAPAKIPNAPRISQQKKRYVLGRSNAIFFHMFINVLIKCSSSILNKMILL